MRPKYLNPSPELERLSVLQTNTGLKGDDLLVEYASKYQVVERREPSMYHYKNGGALHPAYQLHLLFPSTKARQWDEQTELFYRKRNIKWVRP